MDKIPHQVRKAAEHLAEYRGEIVYLGQYKHINAYIYEFKEPVTIGLPEVYLWDKKECTTIFGEDAFLIIDSFS